MAAGIQTLNYSETLVGASLISTMNWIPKFKLIFVTFLKDNLIFLTFALHKENLFLAQFTFSFTVKAVFYSLLLEVQRREIMSLTAFSVD